MKRILTLLCGVYLLGVAASGPVPYLDAWREMQAAVAGNRHQKVVQLAETLSAEQPGDAEVWFLLGRSAFALKRYDLAISASEKAWDLGYRYMPWIALRIARSAAATGQKEKALEWLQRALDRGLEDRHTIADYAEFKGLHEDPRFRSLAGLERPDNRLAGMAADIDYLVGEARRLRPDYTKVGPPFEAAATHLKRELPTLGDREYLFDLMRLVALLGDGHSVVYGPTKDSPLHVTTAALPVKFYLFDEGLYIVDGTGAGEKLIGRRVERIGSKTPIELLEHSRKLHGAENPMTMRWLAPQFYFGGVSFLLDAGAITDVRTVTLTLASTDGKPDAVELEPGEYEFPRKLRPPKIGSGPLPLYLQHVDRNYWLKALPDVRALYFQFNQVRNEKDESIVTFAKRLGEVLAAPNVKHLIVDLRHNNGGNSGLERPLLRQIFAFDVRDGTDVYVITGRNTFSAAQNFLNRLARWTDAVVVGEPSSSSPNFIGEDTQVLLPWSRIAASISSRLWQGSDPGDERQWIAPQLPVPPRAKDYFARRDAALVAILEQISN
jgi:hypothetical protein